MKIIALGLVLAASALAAPGAEACACVGSQSFLEVARDEPVAVVGRIIAVGPRRWAGRESIDLAVDWVGKGTVDAKTIRIWDEWALSDCPGLGDLEVGQSLAIVLRRIADHHERAGWDIIAFKPGESDYLAQMQACRETQIVLRSQAQRKFWMGRRLQ